MTAVEMTQELPAIGTAGDEGHCEVLQGADGPVYFLHQGLLFIVHDLLGRWTEPNEVHWLVSASVGRFGEPAVYRLRCRYVGLGTGGAGESGMGAAVSGAASAAAAAAAGTESGAGAESGAGTESGAGAVPAAGAAATPASPPGLGEVGFRGRIGPSDPYRLPGPGRWTVRRAANGNAC